MEVTRAEFNSLVALARRTDRNLAETQGEVLALRVAVAGLIATHPDKDTLKRVLVAMDATAQLPTPAHEAGYQRGRGLLAQALRQPPPGSPQG